MPADPAEAAEVRVLRTANKWGMQERDLLKKAIAILAASNPMSYQQQVYYPVRQLCQVLGVVPSHYYGWLHAQAVGAVGTTEPAWETEMVAGFNHHKRRYGTRRLQVELRELGHRVGRQALRAGLRRHGRKALQPKSFVSRNTDSTHGLRCALNLLLDQLNPTLANRLSVSDITGLPLTSGVWAYLCAFQDGCTKHVMGWQVRADRPGVLVTSALQRALLAQQPALPGATPGLIIHFDRVVPDRAGST